MWLPTSSRYGRATDRRATAPHVGASRQSSAKRAITCGSRPLVVDMSTGFDVMLTRGRSSRSASQQVPSNGVSLACPRVVVAREGSDAAPYAMAGCATVTVVNAESMGAKPGLGSSGVMRMVTCSPSALESRVSVSMVGFTSPASIRATCG